MAVDGQIVASAQALESGASDVDAIAGQIQQQLDDLRGFVRQLTAGWTGEAATEYQSLQAKWDSNASDLHEVLRQIAAALRAAAENYGQSEKANAAMWQQG